MPDSPIKYNSQLEKDQSDDSANIVGKRSILYGWNSSTLLYERLLSTAGVLQTSGAGGGGGTQYAEGTTQATPTGTVAMGKNASNILHAFTVDGSGNLNVNLAAGSISGGNAAASATGSAVPASADYLGLKDGSGNLVGVTIGQQLAASSIPVILPSATVTTLTPPAAITGFALEAGHLATIDTSTQALGAKTDAKSTATDTTSVSAISVLKQISASVQAPPTQAVTGTFFQSTQPVSIASMPTTPVTGTFFQSTQPISEADGTNVTLGAKADAKNAATDTTAVSAMSVLKQISASVQAPPSQAVTNGGTFAVQATLSAETTKVIGTVNVAASQSIGVTQATGTNLHTVVDSGTVTTVSAVTAITNALPAGTNLLGKVGIDQTTPGTTNAVTLVPSTIGGWTPKSLVALSSTKTAVKAGAGTLGGYMFYNPNATVVYIQVWNVAIGSITVGSTAPTYVIPIPATSGANIEFTNGINHSTEINVAATTTATGSTAPGTAVDGFVLYK